MGLRDIEKKIRSKSAYQRKEAELLLDELNRMIQDLNDLKDQLKRFEKEHKGEIETNKDFYAKVTQIRDDLGLPHELGVYEWQEGPSRFNKQAFYDQLSNEILELGKRLVTKTGGMIAVAELVLTLNKERPGKLVSANDVVKSLEQLSKSGLIQSLRKLPSGVLIAEFIAIELSDDQQTVLDFAASKGFVTSEKFMTSSSWAPERVNRVLGEMVDNGLAIKDESIQEGTKYWFPGLGYE